MEIPVAGGVGESADGGWHYGTGGITGLVALRDYFCYGGREVIRRGIPCQNTSVPGGEAEKANLHNLRGGRGEQVEVPIIRGSLGEAIMLWVRIGLGLG